MIRPASIPDVQTAVRNHQRLVPRGGGTKPALSTARNGAQILDLSILSGVVEYNPGEYTFTALAGTRLSEVQAMLAGHGQYLPFDPPLAERGATLGGTVAAGLSGPGRYRYGGVRDFILGVRLVDGRGQVVRGGGNVVKNSAGFDIPKLVVGSLGTLGVLVETTFKVFPASTAHVTVEHSYASLEDAISALYGVYTARMEIDSLDLALDERGSTLLVRLAGLAPALPARASRVQALLGGGRMLDGGPEAALWQVANEFGWVPPDWNLIKVPLSPKRIAALDEALGPLTSLRRYSSGGSVLWLATPEAPSRIDSILGTLGLAGLVLFGPPDLIRLGARTAGSMEARVRDVFDPDGKFASTL